MNSNLAISANHAISLTSDIKYQKNFSNFDYVNIQAPKKGKLHIGVVGNFDNINNNILMGSSAEGLALTTDSLFTKSIEEIATTYNLLAEYFHIDSPNNRVIFKIREKARWHDSTKITNEDLLYTYNTLKEQGHPYYKIILNKVIKAELLDNNKIAYYLSDINNVDLIQQIGLLPVLAKKYYENNEFNKITLKPQLGSGPYKIKEIKAGKYIIYEKFDNYWAKNLNVNIGRYNFKQIKYSYFRDANIAVQNLKAGSYDLRYENIAKNWANNYDNNFLDNLNYSKELIAHEIPTGMQCFALNLRKEKFQHKKVREALNLAFDFEWTNKALFHNSYERTKSFYSNSPYVAKNSLNKYQISYLKKISAEDYISEYLYTPAKTAGNGNNRTNLLKAQKLLNEAGWTVKNFKLTNAKGDVFKLEFLITSPSFQRVILPYIKNLKKLGIEAKIRMVDYSNYQKSLENFNYDITVYAYPGVKIPGNEQLNFWHSKYANLNGSRNISGIINPIIDKITEDIIEAKDYNKKKDLAQLLDRVLRNNIYVIPHWNIKNHRIILNKNIARPKINTSYGLDIHSWWKKN
ncbi:MAG: ABC transporter substrate-binding protein [Alphaproteobacteria bacterium]|nr:ABC transporter substrate-binding protein [Alphaproteobacteria bacterium]MBT5828386.1 ABC transporter substrate-binding protein [Alphaproteobacteria bacterium]